MRLPFQHKSLWKRGCCSTFVLQQPHSERVEVVISLLYNTAEAHLHISMADFVVYVVVAAPVKPDLIGQPVFHFLFEVAFFQTLPALFLQAQAVS